MYYDCWLSCYFIGVKNPIHFLISWELSISSDFLIEMDNGRQRAHSASSLKSLHVYGPSSKWTKHQARSTPELRMYMQQSMLSGLNTTVPQSLVPQDLGRAHKPKPKQGTTKCCANFCKSCCSLRLFLVFSQLVIGATITAVSFYLFFYTTNSLKIRDTPFWAGIPVSDYDSLK